MEQFLNLDSATKEELKRCNIVIDDSVKIGRNVSVGFGVCIKNDSEIGDNSVIYNNSFIDSSKLDKNVTVKSSFIENSFVGENTSVGPFAHVQKGSVIKEKCRIGNFVEIKNSHIGRECKIAHLSYVGDAEMGDECNIGCGTVFCNYNGKIKTRSKLGKRVFVGSNVNIIAPVEIGDYAYIAAGSTINKNVESNEFAIARARQENKTNFLNPYKK